MLSTEYIEQKKVIIGDILGDHIRHGDEHMYYCPNSGCNHHKKKLSINFKKNSFKCWICGYRGNSLYRLVSFFGSESQKNRWAEYDSIGDFVSDYKDIKNLIVNTIDKIKKTELYIPSVDKTVVRQFPGKTCISLANSSNMVVSAAAKNYLYERGLSRYDILKWQIGFCLMGKYQYRIVVPSYNVNGNMNYFITRTYLPFGEYRYWNPKANKDDIIFNEYWVDWSKDVVLVEGVFDAMKVESNAVPILGSSITERSLIFKRIVDNGSTVVLALDADAKKKSEKIYNLLTRYGIEVYRMDMSGYEDVGQMPKDVVRVRLDSVKEDNSFSYLRSMIEGI